MKKQWIVIEHCSFVHECFDRVSLWVEEKSSKWIVPSLLASVLDELSFMLFGPFFHAASSCDKWCTHKKERSEQSQKCTLYYFLPLLIQMDSSQYINFIVYEVEKSAGQATNNAEDGEERKVAKLVRLRVV